ncbi:MAG: hypothetical protein QXE96_00395 [Candidatus Caldarchaeum sp.]
MEHQEPAYPYHDWNERITAECYGPNAYSRIVEPDGKIIDTVNNYSWISFGLTRKAWKGSRATASRRRRSTTT